MRLPPVSQPRCEAGRAICSPVSRLKEGEGRGQTAGGLFHVSGRGRGLYRSASLGPADIEATSFMGTFASSLGLPYWTQTVTASKWAKHVFFLPASPGLALGFWLSGVCPVWLLLLGPLTFCPDPSGQSWLPLGNFWYLPSPREMRRESAVSHALSLSLFHPISHTGLRGVATLPFPPSDIGHILKSLI